MGAKTKVGKGRSVIYSRLGGLAAGSGLQRPNIGRHLGSGLCRLWGLDPKGDPEWLRAAVTERIKELLDTLPETRGKPHKTIARISYNIAPYPELYGMNLTQRREWLADLDKERTESGIEPDFSYGTTRHHWEDEILPYLESKIAVAWREFAPDEDFPDDLPDAAQSERQGSKAPLERVGEPSRRAQAARPQIEAMDAIIGVPVPEARTPFIPRPYLAEQLDEAWSTAQRVYIIGEAGTGKSRFVREHTAADNPVWIDAREDVTMLPGLTDTLTRYGVEVAHYDTPRIKHAFGELLTRDDGPDLVVMDGVPEPAQLDLFIPDAIRSRLLVTSSQRPGNKATVIAVTDMQLEEATAMAAALLPGFSDDDYRSLAATFGCRPILIEHSCRYLLQETGTPDIPAYCDAVREDIAAAIGAAARKAGRTEPILTVIYQKYVQRLEEESPRSIELLELLCFVSHLNVPPAYAMAYLLGVPMITPELLERAQLRYEDAVQPLVDYSLVSVMPGYGTSMQPLTQRILRGIFQDRFPTVIQRAQPLLQHHDRAGLFEAGWSIFTVAGYLTCNHILTVQAKEYVWPFLSADLRARFAPADAPPPLDGVTESAQWPLIVTELWKRMCGFATFLWDERHAVPERPDTSGDVTTTDLSRDAVLARFKPGRFGIQNEETEAVRNIIFTLMLHVYVGDVYQAWNRDTNQAVFEFNLRDIMTRMLQRYQDSPLGQLDLGLFFPNADDTVEQVLKTADASGTIAVTRPDTPSEHLPAQSKEGPDLRATELATPAAIDAGERDVKNSGDLRLLGVDDSKQTACSCLLPGPSWTTSCRSLATTASVN